MSTQLFGTPVNQRRNSFSVSRLQPESVAACKFEPKTSLEVALGDELEQLWVVAAEVQVEWLEDLAK